MAPVGEHNGIPSSCRWPWPRLRCQSHLGTELAIGNLSFSLSLSTCFPPKYFLNLQHVGTVKSSTVSTSHCPLTSLSLNPSDLSDTLQNKMQAPVIRFVTEFFIIKSSADANIQTVSECMTRSSREPLFPHPVAEVCVVHTSPCLHTRLTPACAICHALQP